MITNFSEEIRPDIMRTILMRPRAFFLVGFLLLATVLAAMAQTTAPSAPLPAAPSATRKEGTATLFIAHPVFERYLSRRRS